MPELPEVQTIISDLNKKIKGDSIADFWSDWPKAIKRKTLKEFQREIKNRKILGARRIGKNIFIDLSGGKTLYIHLKMTGHLLIKSEVRSLKSKIDYFNDKVNQYIHHIWHLGRNKTLEFSDVRKFAKIILDDTGKINELKEIKNLGVDALDKKFTFQKFQEILGFKLHPSPLLKKERGIRSRPIGTILLEQELIAGIGNIYRSEILFEAGILPERKISGLKEKEVENIHKNIKKVLKKAIKYRGTSDSDYRDTAGAPGSFQKVMKVYRRNGKKCLKCDTIIRRMALGQRSVFYCPKCQT